VYDDRMKKGDANKQKKKRDQIVNPQTSTRCGTAKYRSPKLSCPANCGFKVAQLGKVQN
jgi:ribosomal protein L37E